MTTEIKDNRPALFQKTEYNIWTEPYIQKQMLKEHLNLSSDGASRKMESIKKISGFIMENTRAKSRLLDLGCGPGLYTSFFKDKGYDVTGVDFNRASIEYAASKRNDVNYLLADYIENYPEGDFDTIIMIYCDMGTHSDDDRDKLLANIYNSLNKGGVFIFDVFTEGLTMDKFESKDWDYAPMGGFWSESEYLLLKQTFHYPEHRAFAYQYNLLNGNDSKHFIVWDRYYSEKEITTILKNVGFGTVIYHKNLLNSNSFTSDSEMFIIAEKQ